MKTFSLPLLPALAALVAISLSSCGKTDLSGSTTTAASVSSASTVTATNGTTTTYTYTNTTTTTTTSTTGTGALLAYSFTLNGGQSAVTPYITSSDVLYVAFIPGTTQGNNYHSASMLSVNVSLNGGAVVTPEYEASNYVYGLLGEQSNTINLSGYVGANQSFQLTVNNPMNDFYCTYAPTPFYNPDGSLVNALYNSYPGCYKSVPSTQQWSGTLIVQTSNTIAI